jgi:tetratricopeptide (TPR) repeat protein
VRPDPSRRFSWNFIYSGLFTTFFMKREYILICLFAAMLRLTSQTDAEAAFSKSYSFEYESSYGKAISALTEANADNYQVNLRLGWLHYLNKDYMKSEKYYRKAIQFEPQSIEARFGVALPLVAIGNYNHVTDVYREILKIDPNNSIATYRLGLILYNNRDYENAGKQAAKVIRMYPFDYDSNLLYGKVLIAQKKNNEARKFLDKALQYNPQSEEARALIKSLK